MKKLTLAVLVGTLLVVTSIAGYCQTARSVGMGMTGIGTADDAAAWLFNPAGLASMNVKPQAGNDVAWQFIGGADYDADMPLDEDFVHVGAFADNQGFGLGRIKLNDVDATIYGGGYGFKLNSNWSLGASLLHGKVGGGVFVKAADADFDQSETLVNAGVMYQWVPSWSAGKAAKLSVLCFDTFDTLQTLWNAGFSTYVGSKLLVDVDCLDLRDKTAASFDKSGRMFNYGAEYQFNDWLTLRAGSQDGDFGFGGGFNIAGWKIDAGHIKLESNGYDASQTLISLTKDF
ncbi:MAG: hypothetical protein ABFE16_10120 [Armatimonadia bacterium]